MTSQVCLFHAFERKIILVYLDNLKVDSDLWCIFLVESLCLVKIISSNHPECLGVYDNIAWHDKYIRAYVVDKDL